MISTTLSLASLATVALAASIAPRQTRDVGIVGFSNPALRGFNSEASGVQPCGGYKLMGRTDYPISGGQISFIQSKDAVNVAVYYALSSDPRSLSEFQPLLPNITQLYGGETCLTAPDFASFGAAVGTDVTLLLTYQSGPQKRNFYQCADVNLVDASTWNTANVNVECRNITLSTQTMRDSAAMSVSVEASSASATSGTTIMGYSGSLSPAAAGGLGAAVTVALFAIAIGVLLALGKLSFGKRRAPSAQHPGMARVTSDHSDNTFSAIAQEKFIN